MAFIIIRNNFINLEEVVSFTPDFSNIAILYKNGQRDTLYFSDCDKRDEAFEKIHNALSRFGTVII